MLFKDQVSLKFIISVLDEMNISKPTAIQEIFLKEKPDQNIIVQSPTGSGKTLAYIIYLFKLLDLNSEKTQVIIMSPTKELAKQIFEILMKFQKHQDKLKSSLLIDTNNIKKGINLKSQIIVGTPNAIQKNYSNGCLSLDNLKLMIFDEYDMLVNFNFFEEIKLILLKTVNYKKIKYLALSATVSQNILISFKKNFKNMKFINIAFLNSNESKQIKHFLVDAKNHDKINVMMNLVKTLNPYLCFIFVNKKSEINQLYLELKKAKYNVGILSSDLKPRQRMQMYKRIQNLQYSYIICSDVASRGLDFYGISHIISLDLPRSTEYYFHRSGRTGRNSLTGESYLIYNKSDNSKIEKLQKLGISFNKIKTDFTR